MKRLCLLHHVGKYSKYWEKNSHYLLFSGVQSFFIYVGTKNKSYTLRYLCALE